MKGDVPLQIITGASKDLIVLGSLESEERSILDSAMYQGLGVGLDCTARVDMPQQVQVKMEHNPTPSTSSKPTTSADPNVPAEFSMPTTPPESLTIQAPARVKLHSAKVRSHHSPFKLHKSVQVSINKINLQEGVRVKVTANMLAKLPKSVLHDGNSTEGYESMETEIYWPISPKLVEIPKTPEKVRPDKSDKPTLKQGDPKLGSGCPQPKKRMIYAKPSQFMFRICTIGIKKKKPKYYFKCAVDNCRTTFDKLQTWNTHR